MIMPSHHIMVTIILKKVKYFFLWVYLRILLSTVLSYTNRQLSNKSYPTSLQLAQNLNTNSSKNNTLSIEVL